MFNALVLLLGCVLSVIILGYVSPPYIFICGIWVGVCALYMSRSESSNSKAIWFNFAFVILLVGFLEGYSYYSLKDGVFKYQGGYTHGYFTTSEILGYAVNKNIRVSSRKYNSKGVIYDAIYTIGNDGLRVTPPSSDRSTRCILFFGGSFTFGEGVNDRDSMPYIVGELQDLKVHNYGLHGYGPHQMLAAIENGLVQCVPKLVVYFAIPGHVARVAGYSPWDKHGPKYMLENGELKYKGHFDDNIGVVRSLFSRLFEKSYLYKKYFQGRYIASDRDIELYLNIVKSSRVKLESKFPGVRFSVILWDEDSGDAILSKIKSGFQKNSIKYQLVSNILPDFSVSPGKYELSPYDKHPSPLAYRLVSQYIVNRLLPD